MQMIKISKIFIVLFTILILFFTGFTTTFASSYDYNYSNNCINTNEDYLYNYKCSNTFSIDNINIDLLQYVSEIEADSRVASGEYYYFIVFNYINGKSISIYLVRKSAILVNVDLVFNNWNCQTDTEGVMMNHFGLTISNTKLSGNDFIVYSDSHFYYEKLKSTLSTTYGILLSGFISNNDNTFYIPMVTNYNKDIKIHFRNNESDFFFQTRTIPMLEKVTEIPTAIVTTMRMIIPAGLVVLSIFLVIFLIRLVILRLM